MAASACSRSQSQEYLRKEVCYQNQAKQGHGCYRRKGEIASINSRMIKEKTIKKKRKRNTLLRN